MWFALRVWARSFALRLKPAHWVPRRLAGEPTILQNHSWGSVCWLLPNQVWHSPFQCARRERYQHCARFYVLGVVRSAIPIDAPWFQRQSVHDSALALNWSKLATWTRSAKCQAQQLKSSEDEFPLRRTVVLGILKTRVRRLARLVYWRRYHPFLLRVCYSVEPQWTSHFRQCDSNDASLLWLPHWSELLAPRSWPSQTRYCH